MFVILLDLSGKKGQAGQFMAATRNGSSAASTTAFFCWPAVSSPMPAAASWRTIFRCRICKPGSTTIRSSRKTSSARKSSRSRQRKPTGDSAFLLN